MTHGRATTNGEFSKLCLTVKERRAPRPTTVLSPPLVRTSPRRPPGRGSRLSRRSVSLTGGSNGANCSFEESRGPTWAETDTRNGQSHHAPSEARSCASGLHPHRLSDLPPAQVLHALRHPEVDRRHRERRVVEELTHRLDRFSRVPSQLRGRVAEDLGPGWRQARTHHGKEVDRVGIVDQFGLDICGDARLANAAKSARIRKDAKRGKAG